MDNVCAIVFKSIDHELLYTSVLDWVKLAVNKSGISSVECIDLSEEKLTDGFLSGKDVLLISGDCPLIKPHEIQESYKEFKKTDSDVVLFSNGEKGENGSGWFKKEVVQNILANIDDNMRLADIVKKLNNYAPNDYPVSTYSLTVADTAINRHVLSTRAKESILHNHLLAGVDIPISDGVIISPTVEIDSGVVIGSNVVIKGSSKIGSGTTIGQNSVISDSVIGSNVTFDASHIDSARVEDNAKIGPMARIRPNSKIGKGVKLGNFVEIKNSEIGEKTSVSHLTYIGDSDVGKGCNLGCGVVTVNYDGKNKFRTTIGDNVFVGCNCNLIAPVSLADGSYVAAGTTITDAVPPKALAIGRVKQEIKENWVTKREQLDK